MCRSDICNEEVSRGVLRKKIKSCTYATFMDLEKAYDSVDREALWKVLKIYGVSGQILKGIQAIYREANASVRVGEKFSESFALEVGVRQGCVMSPWLFNIFMDECMREMKCKVGNTGAELEKFGLL